MNLVIYLYRLSWKLLTFAALATIIGGISGAALITVISKGIGSVTSLPTFTTMFFLLCLINLASKSAAEIVLLRMTQEAICAIRIDLSYKLLSTPTKKLQSLGKPGLLAILTTDIDNFIQAFQALPRVLGNCIMVLGCLGYLATVSTMLFFIFTTFLVIGVIGYYFTARNPLKQLVGIRLLIGALFKHFRNLIDGSRELRLNAQRGAAFVGQVITPSAENFRDSFVRIMTAYIWVQNTGAVLFYLAIGIMLFLIPLWLPQNTETLTAVTLVSLFSVRPISEMMFVLPTLQQASISLQKIEQLGDNLTPAQTPATLNNSFPTNVPYSIELRGVCHRYAEKADDNHFMLGPLDLTIEQGEILFIVGGNGSGKTTLAMLILGLYDPEAGTTLLNGEPVTKSNQQSYRQHFSAVFSDFHLFEEGFRFDEAKVGAQAEHYLNVLGMAHKVKIVNGKFSTIDLSSGQRKRLALVSSYIEDRPFYLFDEWAADQDPAFKHVFYTELLPELKSRGKAVIVITHDDAYFSYADRIIKLVDGHLQPIDATQQSLCAFHHLQRVDAG